MTSAQPPKQDNSFDVFSYVVIVGAILYFGLSLLFR
jgi:hypothetical protein